MRKTLRASTLSILGLAESATCLVYAQETAGIAPKSATIENTRPVPAVMRANLEERKAVRAETKEAVTDLRADRKEAVTGLQAERREAVMTAQGNASNTRAMLKERAVQAGMSASTTREEMMKNREANRAQIEQTRANFKLQIDAKREETKKNVEAKKAELQQKIAGIKDERKKNLALTINDKFQDLNKKATEQLSQTVTRQEEVIQKIKDRVATLTEQGKDASVVTTKLSDAESKIAGLRAQILAQSAKVYTIAVTTEATLRPDTEKTRDAIRTDIETIRTSVKAVSDILRSTATDLASIK